MERLYKVVGGLALVSYTTLGLCATVTQQECSLVVRVLTPDGRRPRAPISVQEKNGRVHEEEQIGGDARFCDLGILPVTVTVGSDGICNQVTVRDVPISWHRTYLLTVTYDPMACVETLPAPVPVCTILFRVADSAGVWQPHAMIALSRADRKTLKVDGYGRATFVAKVGEQIRGSATAPGFVPAAFTVACSQTEPVEEYIKLQLR